MSSRSLSSKSLIKKSNLKKKCKEEGTGSLYFQSISHSSHSIMRFVLSEGELHGKQLRLLRHPKTGNATLYAIGNERVEELLKFDDGFRSVLLGNNVVSNGSLILLAPMNPALLLLPYLRKYAKDDYVSLKDLLVDDCFPSIKLLENVKAVKSSLKHACHCKEISNIETYKYSESLLVDYIMKKIKLTKESESDFDSGIRAFLEEYLPADILTLIKMDFVPRKEDGPLKKRRKTHDSESREEKDKITGSCAKASEYANSQADEVGKYTRLRSGKIINL